MRDMDRNNDRDKFLVGHLDTVCMAQVRSSEDRIQSFRGGTRDTCSLVGSHLQILADILLLCNLVEHQYDRL